MVVQPQTGFWMGWQQSLTFLRRSQVVSRRQARKARALLDLAQRGELDQSQIDPESERVISMVWLMQLRPASKMLH